MRLLRALAGPMLALCSTAFFCATATAAPSPGCATAGTGSYDHRLVTAGGEESSWSFTTAPMNVGDILIFTVRLAGGDEATNVTVEDVTTNAGGAAPSSEVTSVPFRLLSAVAFAGPGPIAQSVPHMVPISGTRTVTFKLDNEASAVAAKADISVICLQSDPAPAVIVLNKVIDPQTAAPGDEVTITYVIRNALQGGVYNLSFTDPLPAGLFAASPATMTPACGGDVVRTAEHIALEAGAIPPGGSCRFSLTLTVAPDAPPGVYADPTSDITGQFFGVGIRGEPAFAKLLIGER